MGAANFHIEARSKAALGDRLGSRSSSQRRSVETIGAVWPNSRYCAQSPAPTLS